MKAVLVVLSLALVAALVVAPGASFTFRAWCVGIVVVLTAVTVFRREK